MDNCLFPQIEHDMSNKLIIIGNGFDKAHGIESSYWDFRSWVVKQGNRRLIDMMDVFFSNQHEFWGNIEMALGEYDEEAILDFCKPDTEFDYNHSLSSSARVEDAPDAIFAPVMSEFSETFANWVDSIDISDTERVMELPANAKYLTFNYTDTLETVYHIPSNRILHIHGSRIVDDSYVFGHKNLRDEDDVYLDDSKWFFEQNALHSIIKTMNDYRKNTTLIIKKHQDFFEDLSSINQVGVYGLSYSKVDLPYLMEVVNNTGIEIPWHLAWYSKIDFEKMQEFVEFSGLKNIKSFQWSGK